MKHNIVLWMSPHDLMKIMKKKIELTADDEKFFQNLLHEKEDS